MSPWFASSPRQPKQVLEGCLRELNERIPEMNRELAQLRRDLSEREVAFDDLSAQCAAVSLQQQNALDKDKGALAERLANKLGALRSSLQSLTEMLGRERVSFKVALEAFKDYIASKRMEMGEALEAIADQDRRRWEERCTSILSRFQEMEARYQHAAERDGEGEDLSTSLETKLQQGKGKLDKVRRVTAQIKEQEAKQGFREIVRTSENILALIRTRPGEVSKARQFLGYYLDALVRIAEEYASLSQQATPSEDVAHSLERTRQLLKTVQRAFARIQERLMEKDLLQLDTEISVLENVLRMEELSGI